MSDKPKYRVYWECVSCGHCHTSTVEATPRPEVPSCPDCGEDLVYSTEVERIDETG